MRGGKRAVNEFEEKRIKELGWPQLAHYDLFFLIQRVDVKKLHMILLVEWQSGDSAEWWPFIFNMIVQICMIVWSKDT